MVPVPPLSTPAAEADLAVNAARDAQLGVVAFSSEGGLDSCRQLPSDIRKKRTKMFKLAEYLPPFPNATWTLARQAGVTNGVS
jgi:hypothetical protein